MTEVHLCQTLGITYTELQQQPADWVVLSMLYLEGKAKAEKEKGKAKR